jgi:drug/metabolite transporter (DMT)-like permease
VPATDNPAMQRFTRPIWLGASPLILAFVGLVVIGFAVQLEQGWVSVVGDWIWCLTFALVPVIAVNDPGRSRTPTGRVSTATFVVLGLGASALMVWWALVDAAQANRPSDFYTGLLVALGIIAVLSRLLANSKARRAKSH